MMKKIVEKIFFVHCPARGSVFALTLLFFGSWMCFSASIAAWGWELPEKISWRAFWTIRNGEQLFFLLLPLLFAGYFLLMLMRFLKALFPIRVDNLQQGAASHFTKYAAFLL